MPYPQKSALPRSAASRNSRIRRYRPLEKLSPCQRKEAPHSPPRPNIPLRHAPAHEPGSLWRPLRFHKLKLADCKVRVSGWISVISNWISIVSDWMRKQINWIRWLKAISSTRAGLKSPPRHRNANRLHKSHWKPYAAVLLGLSAIAIGRIALGPHETQAVAVPHRVEPEEIKATNPLVVADHYGATAMMLSPNWNERPADTPISAIVIHATATRTGQEAVNNFLNPASHVSSHFVIDRNGAIIEMVPPERRAFHAGASALNGVADLNNYSVGVELVDRNDGQPYSDAQYKATATLIGRLRMHYNIPDDRIVSHASVALPPGRKTDPVGFNFSRLFAALRT